MLAFVKDRTKIYTAEFTKEQKEELKQKAMDALGFKF